MAEVNTPDKQVIIRDDKGKFVPGVSGNPKGRPPRAWTMASLIEDALAEIEPKSGKSFKELVAKRLAHLAVGGDMRAIEEINNRMDGRSPESVDITTKGNEIKFTRDDNN